MKVYYVENQAFVQLGTNRSHIMLCIGSRSEAEQADDRALVTMVEQAIAIAQFRALPAKEVTVH